MKKRKLDNMLVFKISEINSAILEVLMEIYIFL